MEYENNLFNNHVFDENYKSFDLANYKSYINIKPRTRILRDETV